MKPELRTSLTTFARQMNDPDPDGAWKFAKSLWEQHGLVVLFLPDVERKAGWSAARSGRNLAEICYGKRNGGK